MLDQNGEQRETRQLPILIIISSDRETVSKKILTESVAIFLEILKERITDTFGGPFQLRIII